MLRITVSVPGTDVPLIEIKDKGVPPSAVVAECKRKLGLHIPLSLCSAGDDPSDLMGRDVEKEMVLVPIYPSGTEVRAVNMVSHPELNGKDGTVLKEKDGKYAVQFDDGAKGYIAASNLVAVDRKAEAAKIALNKIMESTRIPHEPTPEPIPEPLQLTRDEKRVLIQELQETYPKMGIRDAGTALMNANWDVPTAIDNVKDVMKSEAIQDGTAPSEVAAGALDYPTHRRVEKDFSVGMEGASSGPVFYTCRRCRTQLCSSLDMKHHDPSPESAGKKEFKKKNGLDRISFQECGSIFVEEGKVPWLDVQLNELKGTVMCPNQKCKAKIGTYNWTGQQCSCGHWVCPALQLQQAKMDRFTGK